MYDVGVHTTVCFVWCGWGVGCSTGKVPHTLRYVAYANACRIELLARTLKISASERSKILDDGDKNSTSFRLACPYLISKLPWLFYYLYLLQPLALITLLVNSKSLKVTNIFCHFLSRPDVVSVRLAKTSYTIHPSSFPEVEKKLKPYQRQGLMQHINEC